MDHFFRSLPKQPYAYNIYPDGAPVGKYNAKLDYVQAKVKSVTREKFMDVREPQNHTSPIIVETKYPACTNNGTSQCNLRLRIEHRGDKTNLTESTIKRLNPKNQYIDGDPQLAK